MGETVSRLPRISTNIEREPAALPDARTSGSRSAIQKDGKRVPQHGGAGRREQTHTALNAAIVCSL